VSVPTRSWNTIGPLDGLASSTGHGGDPDNDTDEIDVGMDPENIGEQDTTRTHHLDAGPGRAGPGG